MLILTNINNKNNIFPIRVSKNERYDLSLSVYDDISKLNKTYNESEIKRINNILGVIRTKENIIYYPVSNNLLRLLEVIDDKPVKYKKYKSNIKFINKYYKGGYELDTSELGLFLPFSVFRYSTYEVFILELDYKPMDKYCIFWGRYSAKFATILDIYFEIIKHMNIINRDTHVFIKDFENNYYKLDTSVKVLRFLIKLKTLK